MKCKDCACYKDQWCTIVTDSPDPDMERDCGHFIRVSRWILVTERLPVEAKKVLCFLALSGGPMVETGYYMGDELWYYTGIEAPHHGIVTHWMPLPEPPEKLAKTGGA